MISASDSGVDGDSLSSSTLSHTLIGQSTMSTSDDQAVSETLSDRSDDKKTDESVVNANVTSSPSRIAVITTAAPNVTTKGSSSNHQKPPSTIDHRALPPGTRIRPSATVTKLKAATPQVSSNVTGSRVTSSTMATAQRRKGRESLAQGETSSASTSRSASNSSISVRNSSQKKSFVTPKVAVDSSRISSKVTTTGQNKTITGRSIGSSSVASTPADGARSYIRTSAAPIKRSTHVVNGIQSGNLSKEVTAIKGASFSSRASSTTKSTAASTLTSSATTTSTTAATKSSSNSSRIQQASAANSTHVTSLPPPPTRPTHLPLIKESALKSSLPCSKVTPASSSIASTPTTLESAALNSSSTTSISSRNSKKSNCATSSSLPKSGRLHNASTIASTSKDIASTPASSIGSIAICDTNGTSTPPAVTKVVARNLTTTKKKLPTSSVQTAPGTASARQAVSLISVQKQLENNKKLIEFYKKTIQEERSSMAHAIQVVGAFGIMIRYLTEQLSAFSNPLLNIKLEAAFRHIEILEDKISQKEFEINELTTKNQEREKELLDELDRWKKELEQDKIRHEKEKDSLLEMHEIEMKLMAQQNSSELKVERDRYSDLLSQMDEKDRRILEKSSEITTLQNEIKSLESNLKQDKDKRVRGLQDKVKSLQSEVSSLNVVLELKDDKIKTLNRQLMELEETCKELPATKSSIGLLRQKLEQLEISLENKNQQIKSLLQENESLKSATEYSVREKKRLSLRNEELEFALSESCYATPDVKSAIEASGVKLRNKSTRKNVLAATISSTASTTTDADAETEINADALIDSSSSLNIHPSSLDHPSLEQQSQSQQLNSGQTDFTPIRVPFDNSAFSHLNNADASSCKKLSESKNNRTFGHGHLRKTRISLHRNGFTFSPPIEAEHETSSSSHECTFSEPQNNNCPASSQVVSSHSEQNNKSNAINGDLHGHSCPSSLQVEVVSNEKTETSSLPSNLSGLHDSSTNGRDAGHESFSSSSSYSCKEMPPEACINSCAFEPEELQQFDRSSLLQRAE